MEHVSDEDRQAALTATRLTGWSGVAKRLERGWVPEPGTSEAQLIELFTAHRLVAIAPYREALESLLRDMEEATAYGMAWIDHTEVVEFKRRAKLTLTQLAKGSE